MCVCVPACVCVCVCAYVHLCACVHGCLHVHVHVRTCILCVLTMYRYMCVHICICKGMYMLRDKGTDMHILAVYFVYMCMHSAHLG